MLAVRSARVAASVAAVLLVAACEGGGGGGPAEDPDAGVEAGADDGEVNPPDVVTIDPDEVDPDADPSGIDGAVASAVADLPRSWDAVVVADPTLGPYVIGLPEGATVWRVGDDLGPLRAAAADTAWLTYWDPILVDASEAADGSSLRAVVVLPADEPEDALHLTITATPIQDLPADDPDAIAERFATSLGEQGLSVEEVGTEVAGEREVAALTLTTPDDEFEDGVARRLRQWFYPEPDAPIIWSVTCDGLVPRASLVDEVCGPVLASFRTPPR